MTAKKTPSSKLWVRNVMETSNALDVPPLLFKGSAKSVAQGLKRSAERSRRRKGTSFQSAMSMLDFYINRAGKNLSPARRAALERAKDELRKLFGREPRRRAA
jgi:hypothetical protein